MALTADTRSPLLLRLASFAVVLGVCAGLVGRRGHSLTDREPESDAVGP